MKKLILIFLLFSGLSYSQEATIYTHFSRDFISYDLDSTVVYTINRAFEVDDLFNTALEVFYTVSGSGTSEVDIVNGSATIPIDKAYVDITIALNSSTAPNLADRDLTITITANSNYTIGDNFGTSLGIRTIAVMDESPLKAFPTAYGGGAYAKGGRGGFVYHVTRLDDYIPGSTPIIGTFRWAIEQPRPATIVFDVSGTVVFIRSLIEDFHDLTIAGQSSPLGGITLTTDGLKNTHSGGNNNYKQIEARGECDNLIMRYIAVRHHLTTLGGFTVYSNQDSARNMIFDHLSFSWAGNSSFSTRGGFTENITMQNSIIAESKVGGLMTNSQEHEDTNNISYHNNLFYNASHRLFNNGANGRVDNVNNIIQSWKFRLSYINGDIRYNHLNNYYAMGERTDIENAFGQIFVNFLDTSFGAKTSATTEDTVFDYEVFTNGNIIDKSIHNINDDNRDLWAEFDGEYKTYVTKDSLNADYPFIHAQHPLIGSTESRLPLRTANEVYNELRTNPNVGSNASLNADGTVTRKFDNIDGEYMLVMAQGEGSHEAYTTSGTAANRSHYTEQRYLDFVNNLTTTPINTRPSDFYNSAKSEHIPEEFFELYMSTGDTHNDIAPSGYTWMEEYLNSGFNTTITNVTEVNVNPPTITIDGGNSVQLGVSFIPSNSTNKTGNWGSSNNAVAIVNQKGLVTRVADGQSTIAFTSNDETNGIITDTCVVTFINGTVQVKRILSRKSKSSLISN